MILMDNSFFSRNGDAVTSRFNAQIDAIISLSNYKLNENVESCVGLMTMAGRSTEIITTPINQINGITSKFNSISIDGHCDFVKSLSIAQLALKHRVNKNQHERVILFVASEIKERAEELFKVAKNLRRNNTALDIINICNSQNVRTLEQMIEIVNVDGNSHLVDFNAGTNTLSNVLRLSPVMGKSSNVPAPEFDEEVDPELEMVLRISLEEEKKRMEELARKQETSKMEIETEPSQPVDEERESLLKKASEIASQSVSQNPAASLKTKESLSEIMKDLKLDKPDKKE